MTTKTICRPNLFIVGAPKSGTTSLHYYLSQHPDVLMSNYKEPCFLAPDFSSAAYAQTEEEYLSCFEGYSGECWVGESTTSYLYSQKAASRIHEYSPNAKIIVMLRNPVDMIASLHAQYVKTRNEDIYRFEDALDAEADRIKGNHIPAGLKYPIEYLLYREVGSYSQQLRRYYLEFGQERVHVIIFDDFISDTERVFSKVCRFLDISDNQKIDFIQHNPAQTPRMIILHRVSLHIDAIQAFIAKLLRPITPAPLRRMLSHCYSLLWSLNMKTGRIPLNYQTRILLTAYYEREIRDLGMLLGKNLKSWLERD